MSIHELRERISGHLSSQTIGVLSTRGDLGSWSMPVQYRSDHLQLDCLIPRWADVVYHLELDPQVMLVIQSGLPGSGCWLQYLGEARPLSGQHEPTLFGGFEERPCSPHLYEVFRVTPQRIDLLDETAGWGIRENLDMR